MNFVNKRLNSRPLAIKQFLKKYGDETIKQLIVCRSPLQKVFTIVANLVTFGDWDKQKENLEYDDVFHLYMIIVLETKTVRIEKNSRVEIYDNVTLGTDNLYLDDIPNVTLNQMIDTTEKTLGPVKMWRYDAFSTNCQHFIISLLNSIGLDTHEAYHFILQSADELIQNTFIKSGIQLATDVHAMKDYLVKGGKIKKKPKKRRNTK